MKKIIFIVLINFITSLAFGNEKIYHFAEFESVNVIGNYSVILIKSDSNKVIVKNNDSDIKDENISVELQGAELAIRLKKDIYINRDIEFVIYYTNLHSLTAKRGTDVEFKNVIKSKSIHLSVNSGAEIYARIDSEMADFSVKNGGLIDVDGIVNNAKYYVSKGGSITTFKLKTKTVRAEILFGGEILIHVTKSLFAVVKSGGVIKYKGKPKSVSEEIKLGGKIVKIDK